ncbi:MAG: PPC domain-containing protein [Pirellulaceae bacterium]|nr:PPC domain-containing protein [Pirellulaceae bacterium]
MSKYLVVALALLSPSSVAWSQTAYPMLMSISPVATQTGTVSEHTFRSRYSMADAYQVLVSGEGIRGEIVAAASEADAKAKPSSGETLTVKFHVDAKALPGVRDVRVATPRGVSTVGQVVIVADKVLNEKDANDTRETAMSIGLPATVCGRIEKAEDVDVYRFQVEAGTRLCFHVLCMRLQDRVHDLQTHADPIITIRDQHGSVVASADNTFAGDPLVDHVFDRAGEYFLEIRDVRYTGNNFWEYSVEIHSRPMVTCVYPLAIAPGTPATIDLIGYGLAAQKQTTVQAGTRLGLQKLPVSVLPEQLRPLSMLVASPPLMNEPAADNDTPEKSSPIQVPGVINGRVEREGDVDCYKFEAKKGQKWSFEVFARRAGSALDSHVRILDAKGNSLQLADDMRVGKRNFADSWIENWSVPADGQYTLEIRDLHLRGGEAYVYAIQATPSQPMFLLFADTDKTPLSPGTAGVLYVRAEKKNGFDGEIQLGVSGLPAGIKAHCGRILAGKGLDGCIVFEVDPQAASAGATSAKPLVAPIEITGTATWPVDEDQTVQLSAVANVYQEIYQPGGGRGHWPVDAHIVSVTAPSDIRQVNISQDDIVLKPGQTATIDVELQRAEGFDKNVTLEMTYSHLSTIYGSSLPEGVTIDSTASNTLLTSGATKGKLVLTAAATAPPVAKQQVVVMANVSLNFVMKATYASRPITLSVAK